FSINSIATSPSLNLLTWALPSGRVRRAAILCTSCGLAFPANTIILPADTVPPRVTWSTDHHLNRILGWGARDRTWEWRDQNPLPYRLATPQIQNLQGLSPLRFEPHHQRRSVAAPGHETSPARRQQRVYALGRRLVRECREHAGPRTGETGRGVNA